VHSVAVTEIQKGKKIRVADIGKVSRALPAHPSCVFFMGLIILVEIKNPQFSRGPIPFTSPSHRPRFAGTRANTSLPREGESHLGHPTVDATLSNSWFCCFHSQGTLPVVELVCSVISARELSPLLPRSYITPRAQSNRPPPPFLPKPNSHPPPPTYPRKY